MLNLSEILKQLLSSVKQSVIQFASNFTRSGKTDARVLNLGCGDNPLSGAVNVDIKVLQEVDVAADAYHLPFKDAVFGQIIVQNPYDWHPLISNAVRVLTPDGTLTVVGQPRNPFMRSMINHTQPELRGLGWELIEYGAASEQFKFGTPRTTIGAALDTNVFTQLTYRRL
jgi:SAM-dependent methyltransferase